MINTVFMFQQGPRLQSASRDDLSSASNNDKIEQLILSVMRTSSTHLLNIDQLCIMRMITVVIAFRLVFILSLTPFLRCVVSCIMPFRRDTEIKGEREGQQKLSTHYAHHSRFAPLLLLLLLFLGFLFSLSLSLSPFLILPSRIIMCGMHGYAIDDQHLSAILSVSFDLSCLWTVDISHGTEQRVEILWEPCQLTGVESRPSTENSRQLVHVPRNTKEGEVFDRQIRIFARLSLIETLIIVHMISNSDRRLCVRSFGSRYSYHIFVRYF